MCKISYFVIVSLCAGVLRGVDGSVSEMVTFLMGHNGLLNCISDFNEECVNSYGKGSLEKLLYEPEIPLDSYVSLERLGNSTKAREESLNIWSLGQLSETLEKFMRSHALKVKVGSMVGRMFESRREPDNLEVTIDALTRGASVGTAKSQRIYRVVIPLVMGFKVTGMIIFGIFAVKLFLMKATLVANAALLVSGFIVLKKLYDHGMNMLNTQQHHGFGAAPHAVPSYYPKEEPNFSGYGGYYGQSYDNTNSLGGYSSDLGGGDTSGIPDVVPGGNDLQGHYSHHAIAMAALNKTLQNRPKRRWSYKWT